MNPTKLRTPLLIADEFLEQLKVGVEWGTGNRLLMRHVSEDGRFVVWTIPGGNCWSGLYMTRYHRARTILSDLSWNTDDKRGITLYHATKVKEWEGRFGKVQKAEALTMINIATMTKKKGLVKR